MKKALTLFILATALCATASAQSSQKAPNLVLKDSRGRQFRLSDYRGKVVLLNFWATWCPPCRAEMPELVKWQKEYRNQGLQVIGITYPPTDRNVVRRFIRRVKVNYPVVFGTKETKALFDKSETLPITVVIDHEGNIREMIQGILLPEEFEEKIRPLLKQSNRQNMHQTSLRTHFAKGVVY